MNKVEDTEKFISSILAECGEEMLSAFQDYESNIHALYNEVEYLGRVLYNFKYVEEINGSYDDCNEAQHCHIVFKWKDTYYKIKGERTSYSGVELDPNIYIVTPKQRLVVTYYE